MRARPRLAAAGWIAALSLSALAGSVVAQEAADCLACHGEKDISTERKGRTVSLFVSEKAYSASIHGGVDQRGTSTP